jgi:tetratricopeptide (TPR) repeat protein
VCASLCFTLPIRAAVDIEAARKDLLSGRYAACVSTAQAALQEKADAEEWGTLLMSGLLAQGKYAEALAAATNALAGESPSLRLRWSGREAALANGDTARAAKWEQEIHQLFTTRPWLYRAPRDAVIFGRVILLGGMDPKLVLDRVYDRVKKADPKLREVYLASGELALEKHDFALAAKFYREGLKQLPEDPDLHFGLARAYAPSDQKLMLASLAAALDGNTNHVGSLLMLADHSIDAEDYPAAERFLDRIQAINHWEPEAWAYRAVLAHLHNRPEQETEARATALKFWSTNPRIDHLIGLKLSQKYRFSLGATYQKRALAFDGDYLPAKSQLSQDLLRLGEETEGWRVANEVQRADSYDVAANNLMALHDVIAKFKTLTNAHFVLRMPSREAAIYGQRALDLLESAHERLVSKYGARLSGPTLVEMFNDEKDFAVRTFGMPDNDGFLGVCFGEVITANSPSARSGIPFNWESMLWHEFCHVVTLQLTHNKMPRWLSEGISVYEERQAQPSWGERLNPRYREMLLGKELTPVSKLSGAFLAPKSAQHLQFAYYQSSLVVQFLVEKFGAAKLVSLLHALREGTEINDALAKLTVPMPRLEAEFKNFAVQIARNMAPGLDWEKPLAERLANDEESLDDDERPHLGPPPARLSEEAWTAWAKDRPTNYWALTHRTERLIAAEKWTEAKPLLEKLVALYPDSIGRDSAYRQLATVHRALGETNSELRVLARLAEKDDTAVDAYSRLMALAIAEQDWSAVRSNAQRYLAVNPLLAAPHRYLARASEASGQPKVAIQAYQAALELEPPDPAEVHYRLARLLHANGDPAARRHLLQALEEAPRFRDALRLLRQMNQPSTNTVSPATAAIGPSP